MASRELLDASGKISAQFLPNGSANTYCDNPMTENLDANNLAIQNVSFLEVFGVDVQDYLAVNAPNTSDSVVEITANLNATSNGRLGITWNYVTVGDEAGELVASDGPLRIYSEVPHAGNPGPLTLAAEFKPSVANLPAVNVAAASRTLIFGVPLSVTSNQTNPANNLLWPNIGPKYPLVVGGTYSLQGAISLAGSAGLNRYFKISVGIGDTAPQTLYYINNANTLPYTAGQPFQNVTIPFNIIFKADYDGMYLTIDCPTITGAESLDLTLAENATLIRIL